MAADHHLHNTAISIATIGALNEELSPQCDAMYTRTCTSILPLCIGFEYFLSRSPCNSEIGAVVTHECEAFNT